METSSLARKIKGWFARFTTGLSSSQLEYITANARFALLHRKGAELFKIYLTQAHRSHELACIDLFEKCCHFIEKDHRSSRTNPSTASLEEDTHEAMLMASCKEFGCVLGIYQTLKRYNDSLESPPSRDLLQSILEETKTHLIFHLREAHISFRRELLA